MYEEEVFFHLIWDAYVYTEYIAKNAARVTSMHPLPLRLSHHPVHVQSLLLWGHLGMRLDVSDLEKIISFTFHLCPKPLQICLWCYKAHLYPKKVWYILFLFQLKFFHVFDKMYLYQHLSITFLHFFTLTRLLVSPPNESHSFGSIFRVIPLWMTPLLPHLLMQLLLILWPFLYSFSIQTKSRFSEHNHGIWTRQHLSCLEPVPLNLHTC